MGDTLKILHVVVTLTTGNERWEGNGFWELPNDADTWHTLGEGISRAVFNSALGLIDATGVPRFKIEGESYEVKGLIAAALRNRVVGRPVDDPERVLWDPIIANRWKLSGEVNRG